MARSLPCFNEIMRLSPDGSSVHENDCMKVCDDDGMEVCDDNCKHDFENLRDGPNHDIKDSDIFDGPLDAMDTCECNKKMYCIEPCDIYRSAATPKQ